MHVWAIIEKEIFNQQIQHVFNKQLLLNFFLCFILNFVVLVVVIEKLAQGAVIIFLISTEKIEYNS